jgi:hypothetical protein
LVPFWDWGTVSTDTLSSIPLMLVTNASRTGCSASQIEFNTSLLLLLGPRTYQTNKLECVIMGLIGTNYRGWLTTYRDSNNRVVLQWSQAKYNYDGPGFLVKNAEIFTLENPTNDTATLTKSGETIYVLDTGLNSVALGTVLFSLVSLNSDLCTRGRQSTGNCNLLYHATLQDFEVVCT